MNPPPAPPNDLRTMLTSTKVVIAITVALTMLILAGPMAGIRPWLLLFGALTALGTVGLVVTVWVINQPTSPLQVSARTIAQLRNRFIIGLDAMRGAPQRARCRETQHRGTPAETAYYE